MKYKIILKNIQMMKTSNMAGNKYNTPFKIHRPAFYRLEFQDEHGQTVAINGTTKQVINYILNQQL